MILESILVMKELSSFSFRDSCLLISFSSKAYESMSLS